MISPMLSNLLVHVVLVVQVCTKLLPCPTGEDAPRDISLWVSSCKNFSSWIGHKKNPDGEIKKPSGLYGGCNFVDY